MVSNLTRKRQMIAAAEKELENSRLKIPIEDIPVVHGFSGNVYTRSMQMKEGQVVVGKEHVFPCLNLVHGHLRFINQADRNDVVEVCGFGVFESPADTKRVIVAMLDSIWTTVHEVGEERDLEVIESRLIK